MGINYLALDDLFQISNERKDTINYDIRVQMVEIYNEQIRDLLAEDSSTTKYPFVLSMLPYRNLYSFKIIIFVILSKLCVTLVFKMLMQTFCILNYAHIRDTKLCY